MKHLKRWEYKPHPEKNIALKEILTSELTKGNLIGYLMGRYGISQRTAYRWYEEAYAPQL